MHCHVSNVFPEEMRPTSCPPPLMPHLQGQHVLPNVVPDLEDAGQVTCHSRRWLFAIGQLVLWPHQLALDDLEGHENGHLRGGGVEGGGGWRRRGEGAGGEVAGLDDLEGWAPGGKEEGGRWYGHLGEGGGSPEGNAHMGRGEGTAELLVM